MLALFMPLLLIAQETEVGLPRGFNAILDFFLPVLTGQIIILLSDAKKYMGSGIWSWGVFFSTKIKPFLITLGIAVGVYLLLAYASFMQPFLEVFTGPIGALTAAGLFAAAQAIIDGWSKPTVDPEAPQAVSAVNMRYDQPVGVSKKHL